MTGKDNSYVEQFDKALEAWKDERFVTQAQVRDLAMFSLYLVNLLDDQGIEYVGHSFRLKGTLDMLVVKGVVDGIPHVVFTSGKGLTGCVHIFLRKLDEGWLEWAVDRFA